MAFNRAAGVKGSSGACLRMKLLRAEGNQEAGLYAEGEEYFLDLYANLILIYSTTGESTEMKLQGCEVCENDGEGIHLEDSAKAELFKVHVPISMLQYPDCIVLKVLAGGNKLVGIRVEDEGSKAILYACYITNNKTGMHVWEQAHASLQGMKPAPEPLQQANPAPLTSPNIRLRDSREQ